MEASLRDAGKILKIDPRTIPYTKRITAIEAKQEGDSTQPAEEGLSGPPNMTAR